MQFQFLKVSLKFFPTTVPLVFSRPY